MVWLIGILMALIVPTGVHDDSYLPLAYTGVWAVVEDSNAHGGSYRQTDTGSLTFSFVGSGFVVYGTQIDGGGSADICIEDDCYVASWQSAITAYQVGIIAVNGLDDEQHNVTIAAVGDGLITVDAVYIAPSAPQQPAPEPTQGWVSVNDAGDAVTENRITSGDQAIFLTLVAILVVLLVMATLQIRASDG